MEVSVGIGEIKVVDYNCTLKAIGLGSCIAVALYDENTRIAGLAHFMLPSIDESHDRSNPSRFIDSGLEKMIDEMKKMGAQPNGFKAKIFGGANMFPDIIFSNSPIDIGQRNIQAVREELRRHSINITAEELGGHIGRSMIIDTKDDTSVVNTVHEKSRKY